MGFPGKFLEDDAVLHSLVALATNGIVDFSKAHFRDARWWRLLRIHIRNYQQQVWAECADKNAEFLWRNSSLAALLAPYKAESAKEILEKTNYQHLVAQHLRYPWIYPQPQQEKQKVVDDLVTAWVRAFGDYNDPVVRAKIEATAALMQKTT